MVGALTTEVFNGLTLAWTMWLRVSCGGSGAAMGLCLFGVVSGSPRSAAHLQLFGLAAGVWATAGGSEEGCWHGFAVGRVQKQENP